MLKKHVAGLLAIFLGAFGTHNFYLGRRGRGIFRFASFVFVMFLLIESGEEFFGFLIGMAFLSAVIEGILLFLMPQQKFDEKYNTHHSKVTAPANIADLKSEGVDYFKSGDYDLAIEAFKEALEVNAADPGVHFNLACCYSKTHDLIAALHHLELSISYGLPEPKRIDRHPALEWLRRQPAFATFQQQNYRQLLLTPDANPVTETTTTLELPNIEDIETGEDELITQIRKLGKLREMGILTEAEFKAQKEKLLA